MSGPYRESAGSSIQCPRCGVETASGDIVACIDGCGIWVHAEVADTAFEPIELRPSRITSWFRPRSACPQCSKQMTLRGHDMSLFQGCDSHGFWVDDSTVTQTGLGRIAVAPRVIQARAQAKLRKEAVERALVEEREAKLAAERAARERGTTLEAERARAREEAERAAREAEEERLAALRDARRSELRARIRAAVADNNVEPLVDELLRLHDAIEALAQRMTDARI